MRGDGFGVVSMVRAGALDVAFEESGDPGGPVVVLLHGFPYDVRAFDDVATTLARARCRVVVPYLRGYGPTRFVSRETPRSGQQGVLGLDLLALLDALSISTAVVGGFDWGGRAACIVAALRPERVKGLVSCGGYNVQDLARAGRPAPPDVEHRLWYQYYFHGDRGRAGLTAQRAELGRYLWRLWSPTWHFDEATYQRTAASFENPDFVDVVLHSYRHRHGLVEGDPAAEAVERALAVGPPITVPTVVLDGADDGVTRVSDPSRLAHHFTGRLEHHVLPGVGHDVPQEAPAAFAEAVLSLVR
jgi:pimeloyl-ACP methyl ester carboxylesterase